MKYILFKIKILFYCCVVHFNDWSFCINFIWRLQNLSFSYLIRTFSVIYRLFFTKFEFNPLTQNLEKNIVWHTVCSIFENNIRWHILAHLFSFFKFDCGQGLYWRSTAISFYYNLISRLGSYWNWQKSICSIYSMIIILNFHQIVVPIFYLTRYWFWKVCLKTFQTLSQVNVIFPFKLIRHHNFVNAILKQTSHTGNLSKSKVISRISKHFSHIAKHLTGLNLNLIYSSQ